jgi:hypothetical protein
MRNQVAEQAQKMSEFMEEYNDVRSQLTAVHAKEAARQLTDVSTAAVKDEVICVRVSEPIFSFFKPIESPISTPQFTEETELTEETKLTEEKELPVADEIVLRDPSPSPAPRRTPKRAQAQIAKVQVEFASI